MKTYKPELLGDSWPWFIQPKLNGVYAELGTDGLFRSKTGKFFPAVQQVMAPPSPKDYIDLGEFYVHGWSLQQIISAITPDKPNELTRQIRYETYGRRFPAVDFDNYIIFTSTPLSVATYQIHSQAEGNMYYQQFIHQGYEGAVYKPYNRGEPLKRKPFKDSEYACVGVTEGVGKRTGHVGKFILRTSDGRTFGCGGGRVSYDVLRELFANPPVGKYLTIRYQHLSDDGIPLCPQFISVRCYE